MSDAIGALEARGALAAPTPDPHPHAGTERSALRGRDRTGLTVAKAPHPVPLPASRGERVERQSRMVSRPWVRLIARGGRGGIAPALQPQHRSRPRPRLPAAYFAIHKIATTVCYRCVMITLIFALAVRLVARVAGAVAARLSHFLAASLLGPAAGKMFSLPAGSGKLAQRFDVTTEFRSDRVDFGAKPKIFPTFPGPAGKIVGGRGPCGAHHRGAAARPQTTSSTNAPTIMIGEKAPR
jgi:hypothetical protein